MSTELDKYMYLSVSSSFRKEETIFKIPKTD